MMSHLSPLALIASIVSFFCGISLVHAQNDLQIMSVTPPLFQISVVPGDTWQSSIRVVNSNPYDLTVYAELVNFVPEGEKGQPRFMPLITDETTSTLAEWITIAEGPYVISPEQSMDVPFFLDIPDDAPPGGHFAAVLIGTQPPQKGENELAVRTSQAVASLFFVRIAGDIVEVGDIREFSVRKKFLGNPKAELILRFENKGNVHLQPKGDIVITNMWGKERGVIPVNQKSHFGNVLPGSIREFNFAWRSEPSITEIGRYKAVVTLAYGEDGVKNTHAATYFWVIPIKVTLITLASVLCFVVFIIWAVRAYVRRMLALAGVEVTDRDPKVLPYVRTEQSEVPTVQRKAISYTHVAAPLRRGASDLRSRLREVHEFFAVLKTVGHFIVNYRIFFGSVLLLIIGFIAIVLFIADASQEQRSYEVIIEEDGIETTVDSEEIIKDRLTSERGIPAEDAQDFVLVLINASGRPGLAAETAVIFEAAGYTVDALRTGEDGIREFSAIYYDDSLESTAEALSELLGDELLLIPGENKLDFESGRPQVEIILGTDRAE